MTATEIATQHIADLYHHLDATNLAKLREDNGLIVEVDIQTGSASINLHPSANAVEVAVWHREDDNMIVAFHNPGQSEEWDERAVPQIRYHVFASDKVANDRTSDNVAEWSDYQNPMTKDELLSDLDQHDATDIDWYTDTELLVTWTNPFNGERERIFFFMELA